MVLMVSAVSEYVLGVVSSTPAPVMWLLGVLMARVVADSVNSYREWQDVNRLFEFER